MVLKNSWVEFSGLLTRIPISDHTQGEQEYLAPREPCLALEIGFLPFFARTNGLPRPGSGLESSPLEVLRQRCENALDGKARSRDHQTCSVSVTKDLILLMPR